MSQYKDTTSKQNTLVTQNKRYNERFINTVANFLLVAGMILFLLLVLTSYHPANAKNHLQSMAGMMDNKDLSKSKSGMPNRYSLAFFVPKYRLTSQVNDTDSATPLTHFTGLYRHIMPAMAASYDEVTPQNKIAEKRICGAVAFTTESEPCLTPFRDKQIIITQNVKGVANRG